MQLQSRLHFVILFCKTINARKHYISPVSNKQKNGHTHLCPSKNVKSAAVKDIPFHYTFDNRKYLWNLTVNRLAAADWKIHRSHRTRAGIDRYNVGIFQKIT